MKRNEFSISKRDTSPFNLFALGFACVGSNKTLFPTEFTKPTAERIPPPFLIDTVTCGSNFLAYHKLASDDKFPKLVSSVLTKFLRPSKNTLDLPTMVPSFKTITAPIAAHTVRTFAPLVPAVNALA